MFPWTLESFSINVNAPEEIPVRYFYNSIRWGNASFLIIPHILSM